MATATQSTSLAYASGQTPRERDVVRAKGTRAMPGTRIGTVKKVYAADHQIRPGRVWVDWQNPDRKTGLRRSSRVKPDMLELVHCAGCTEDGTRMVPDSSGGVEWDACPRCCRIEDSGSAPVLDDTPF